MTGAKLDRANVAEADLTGSIMDDKAPIVMTNFNMAFVDDRSYREIMSRLRGPKPPSDYSKQLAKEKKAEDSTNGKDEKGKSNTKPKRTIFDSLKGNKPNRRGQYGAAEPELEIRDYIATMDDLANREGWFRILGIDVDTPLMGITKAFRKKAKQFHPDMVRAEDDDRQEFCRLQFELIHESYEKLSNFKSKPLKNLKMPEDVPFRRTPYEYTLEEYLKLVKVNPNHLDLLYNLGWKYFELGDMDKAIETYERVLGIDRGDEDAEYNLRIIKLLKSFDLPPELALEAPA